MKIENKCTMMVWAVVILAVMNISTLVTIMYSKFQSEKVGTDAQSDPKQLEADSEKFSGRYFREQLNLNRKQMEKFWNLNQIFRPKAREITIKLAEKRKQMLVEMAASQSDTIRLNALSDSIGWLHTDLKKVTYRYYLDIRNLCDQEQQSKLEQLISEMFANDAPMGYPGASGLRGRQQGKRFNN